MTDRKLSPISVEIIARCGRNFIRIWVVMSIAALMLIVSSVLNMLG